MKSTFIQIRVLSFLLGLLSMSLFPAYADVQLSPIFGDHMVLQRAAPLPVWGEAAPGERVEVRLPGQQKTTVADARGHWKVRVNPRQPGNPVDITITGAS